MSPVFPQPNERCCLPVWFFALTLTLVLLPEFDPPVFALLFAAVMVSARYGGLTPGLLATILAVLGINLTMLSSLR